MSLVTTKDELISYVSVSINIDFDNISPYIKRAENEFLKHEIGTDLYNAIAATYISSGSSSSSANNLLLPRLQESLCYLGLYLSFDTIAVHISDAGIQRVESTDRKTAYQYQEQNLRANLLESGLETLGVALDFMEDNKEDYDEWSDDAVFYNKYKYLLIHKPSIFQNYIDIRNSWSLFFKLRPIIKMVEDFEIEGVIGSEFLTELKDEIKEDGTTNATLIEMIRKAVAFYTISKAVQMKLVNILPDGSLRLRQGDNRAAKEDAVENERISSFILTNEKAAKKYMDRVISHLNKTASADKYATYYESEYYNDPSADDYSESSWTNDEDGKSVIV